MSLEPMLRRLDRIAGGRAADHRVEPSTDPKVRRAFTVIAWLLVVCFLLGIATVVTGVVLLAVGAEVTIAVWMRCLVVLGISTTLFYFLWRARAGWYWAYRRLQLFSRIFPVIALVLAAIPGLYPLWVITEQIVFALILIGVSDYLQTDYMRAAFPKPAGREPGTDA
ncbi:MAG: hypothetical protein J0I33_05980 [Microbacterium ginsengisoli]|jgi:hypothetical protein|uniref:hypothetical protein n=1 Tax=Microbacterium TaxID=33882 RepID=UPI0006F69A5D|nr:MULTISPECIES: hypothetical protein [unclassified Microbacterium]MBN9198169.1 hypothetical protein [Microbacterium ginsengisoli]KQR91032.1 hypothetical protein ASG00_05685 [Microbacterium sp. Leaf351]KQR95940.1 hypothetical protein ASF93_13565 [Microbacterium sp. Leaf347]ODU79249.1 MAG: hypothetical protein ABT08_01935 [Microbacterium sp. SCN 71-21]OJU78453.1 MAG: hypothetical protein BGO15_12960 [Microbacterium sp. 71-23]